jgi:hypothetical protein
MYLKSPFSVSVDPGGLMSANLFSSIHRLDAMGLDLIVAERAPSHGLGLAINDRLRRAAICTANGNRTEDAA